MATKTLSFLALLTAIGLLGAVLPGCKSPAPPTREAPTVTVARPVSVPEVTDYAEFTGTTKSERTLEARARVQGYLLSVKEYTWQLETERARAEGREPDKGKIVDDFVEGSIVEKGRLLFVIEPAPYQAQLAQAEARRAQAVAKLELAQANFERADALFKKSTITKQEFDTRKAERNAAQAEVMRGEADVQQANIDLGYTTIVAPFTGRAGRRLVDFGNLVGAADHTLLTTVEMTGPRYAYFDIDERIATKIQRWRRERKGDSNQDPQLPVELGLMDEKGYPHKGLLDFVDNAIDPGTGTKLVRGVFPNEDDLISPGAFVRLRVPGQPIPNALLVEEKAICTDLEGKYLWVVDEKNVARKRHVERGPLIDGRRVILKGIGPEDRYVVTGSQNVRDKMPVQPVEAARPEPAAESQPEENAQQPPGSSKTPD